MADSKTTALTELTTPALTDLIYAVANPGGTPASRKLALSTLKTLLLADGWVSAGVTWTYASASTFTVSGDVTATYTRGLKLKWTQTTVKYGMVVSSSYGAPNTTVTILVNNDYTIANAAISANYVSEIELPTGWPDTFTFTPTWASSGTQPVYNNATVAAYYRATAHTFFFMISITMGAGTTYGTGDYTWSLPVNNIAAVAQPIHVSAIDSGTGYRDGQGYLNNSVNTFRVQHTTNTNAWGQLVPQTWATGDVFVAWATIVW